MDKSQLKKQLIVLGVWELFAWKRELQPLAHLLREDERILAATSGVLEGRRWLLAVTHRRYLFVSASLIGGAETFELAPGDVMGCSGKNGFLFGCLRIELKSSGDLGQDETAGGGRKSGILELRNVPKKTIPPMVSAVADLSSGP
jgi:hypothetical protein